MGLLGGTHCVGMCGGIVGALAGQSPAGASWTVHFFYNLGRVTSYVLAGALVGALGGMGQAYSGMAPVQFVLYLVANLMLVALGFYLMGFTRTLVFTERIGQILWIRIQPLTRRFIPVRGPAQAFPLGMLWGWLPCGLVYSVLATALGSGSAGRGTAIMLAFGLGTFPNLLLAGFLLSRFRRFAQSRTMRVVAGLFVLSFGLHGLLNGVRMFMH